MATEGLRRVFAEHMGDCVAGQFRPTLVDRIERSTNIVVIRGVWNVKGYA